MTMVCSCKVKQLRSGEYGKVYDNMRELLEDEDNVYIGRYGRVPIRNEGTFCYKQSIWANPYKVNEDGDIYEILYKYKIYIIKKIVKEKLYKQLNELNGKRLCCWCKPNDCHGDVLKKILKHYNKRGKDWLKDKVKKYKTDEED